MNVVEGQVSRLTTDNQPGQLSTAATSPTRAARSSRSRGVFFAPGKRLLSGVVIAAALFTLAAMLGTTKVVDSATFNANAGPRLVASASLAPALFTPALR